MKIFDMHIHTGAGTPDSAGLLEKMEQAGVYGGVLFSAAPEESTADIYKLPYRERLKNILEWTKGYDDRLFPVMFVHCSEKDVCGKIKDAASCGVRGFKVICDTEHIYDPSSMKMMEAIAGTGLPVFFHSGILWSGRNTSEFNRPANWECMLDFTGLKFSLAHCSWPWYDECIAVYGKILNSYRSGNTAEMFFDLTPGTPRIYREDLLTKLFTVGYDVEDNIMFGTDSISTEYDPEWVKGWISLDDSVYEKIGVTEEQKEKIYHGNILRFLNNGRADHRIPLMNTNA